MKIISLIVPSHHTIFVEHLCHLFDPAHYTIKIYTTPQYVRELETEGKVHYQRHQVLVPHDGVAFPEFIGSSIAGLNQSDLIIFPTLRDNFAYYAGLDWRAPILLCVHNIKYWFQPKDRVPPWELEGWRQKISNIKSRFINDDQAREKFLHRVDVVNFHNPGMVAYFQKNCPQAADYPTTTLPFSLYIPGDDGDGTSDEWDGDEFVFTVPGEVVEGRKNHLLLIEAFGEAADRFPRPVTVVLLGKFNCSPDYRDRVLAACDRASRGKVDFSLFLDPKHFGAGAMMLDDLFDREMKRAHCFVSAMKDGAAKYFRNYKEIFGQTASSGLSFDIIRYQTPGIFKANHEYLADIVEGVEIYQKDQDLPGALLAMTDLDHLQQKRAALREVSQHYSREAVLKRFKAQLKSEAGIAL